jgi:hypothetical protein
MDPNMPIKIGRKICEKLNEVVRKSPHHHEYYVSRNIRYEIYENNTIAAASNIYRNI